MSWELSAKGGDVDPSAYSLIQSLYRRYGLVKRRGTSSRGAVDIEEVVGIKEKFVAECEEIILEKAIPKELMINYDETALPIVPTSDYTMDKKGKKTIKIYKKGI